MLITDPLVRIEGQGGHNMMEPEEDVVSHANTEIETIGSVSPENLAGWGN